MSDTAGSTAAVSHNPVKKLDELFRPWNRSDAPGLIVGVAKQGKLMYRRAFGLCSLENGHALTPGMRMRIGSTSKHFCSLGIMMLSEEGKLDINRPIGTWVPELGPICGRPSLLQLMRHTGGLHDPLSVIFFQSGGHYTQLSSGGHLQMMSRFKECSFEPGSRFSYSNSGYQLLSLVTERASGMSWGDFLDERIFHPMGMSNTEVHASDLEIAPNMATLHVHGPDGKWRRGIYPSDENLGSGGIISTVDDMLKWTAHLRSANKKIGSDDIWRRMLERQVFTSGSSHCYGLGLMLDEHRGVKTIHHAGATMGSTHQMLTAPEHELDIVVMSNRMDVSSSALALKALEAVLEHEGLTAEPVFPTIADYPAMRGRWYSRSSKTLIEISARQARPDGAELLLLSTFNQPIGHLKKAVEGLALPEGPFSTIEFRRPPQDNTPGSSLDAYICGDLETFERLPDDPPSAERLAADFCGRYRQPGYPKEAEIIWRDGKLVLDLLPLHGSGYWELQPYSDEVVGCGPYHSMPRSVLPNSAALTFERKDGRVIGFSYHNDRMRGMWFERL